MHTVYANFRSQCFSSLSHFGRVHFLLLTFLPEPGLKQTFGSTSRNSGQRKITLWLNRKDKSRGWSRIPWRK